MAKFSNPVAFTRGPVTIITTLLYAGLLIALIVSHTSLPSIPKKLPQGINITEAWLDLQQLSAAYHPYNSRANDYVRDWLLLRIESILAENVKLSTKTHALPPAYVLSDTTANLTFSSPGSTTSTSGVSVYFEGTNIIVYIRGSEDDQTEWWRDPEAEPNEAGGVLVNAHFDSVSTGFGATDDGVGVITILQLIKYYTTEGNTPKKGLVALLNNGEEDFLNGARVFSRHPIAKFPRTFLNLEGAGAGGRAPLFRSTDAEVTRAYGNSPRPFGSVVTGDGFALGLVKSQTDYVIFNGILGLRGLDIAFFEPRARYHTAEDDSRHTSRKSVWHMLSSALATTKSLTSDTSLTFNPGSDRRSHGVWFDIFGRVFALMELHTVFALSVTALVVFPVALFVTCIVLHNVGKFYLWSSKYSSHTSEGDEPVSLYGWRGFWRFPLVFLLACAAPIALAYLLVKQNAYIVHSSEWAVWGMMLSSFVFVAWFLCRVADSIRPSALTRAYCFLWMFVAWWAIMVVDTVFETQMNIGGGYWALFFFAGVFLAAWISLLELFALPKKSQYCLERFENSSGDQSQGHSHGAPTAEAEEDGEDEATERTGLLGRTRKRTFANYTQEPDTPAVTEDKGSNDEDAPEQDWSTSLPSWTWILQLIVLAPFVLIIVGQIALLIVSALHQTLADGSSAITVYIFMALLTIIFLSPLVPFLHRFTWHVPMFLLVVFTGTLIYNLAAFPFSPNNRLKLFFQQSVDLDSGINSVSLTGLTPYVQDAISSLPSAAGQHTACIPGPLGVRATCSWPGLAPHVVDPTSPLPPEARYRSWLSFNVTRLNTTSPYTNLAPVRKPKRHPTTTARFVLSGRDTRACKLTFARPITSFCVHGQGVVDDRFPPVPEGGSKEIRLWSRTWNRAWTVDVEWDAQATSVAGSARTAGGDGGGDAGAGMAGNVTCLWSDGNASGVIPALDEVRHFVPEWVAVTKAGDGLVEGFKRFIV